MIIFGDCHYREEMLKRIEETKVRKDEILILKWPGLMIVKTWLRPKANVKLSKHQT